MKTHRFRDLIACLASVVLVSLTGGCGAESQGAVDPPALQAETGNATKRMPVIANEEAVIRSIREGLKAHAREITIRFADIEERRFSIQPLVADWMDAALSETASPVEGDYLRYQYGGYTVSAPRVMRDDGYYHQITITPKYYCYLYEEEKAGELFDDWIRELEIPETATAYEIVHRCYDAVCNQIGYDKVHASRPEQTIRSTLYGTLKYHRATCQGYCVLLYRTLKTYGIDCRIISGRVGDEYHTWNLVNIDGLYYALDATWDAGEETYAYFLKGTETMRETHVPDDSFLAQEFQDRYPVAETDFSGFIDGT